MNIHTVHFQWLLWLPTCYCCFMVFLLSLDLKYWTPPSPDITKGKLHSFVYLLTHLGFLSTDVSVLFSPGAFPSSSRGGGGVSGTCWWRHHCHLQLQTPHQVQRLHHQCKRTCMFAHTQISQWFISCFDFCCTKKRRNVWTCPRSLSVKEEWNWNKKCKCHLMWPQSLFPLVTVN